MAQAQPVREAGWYAGIGAGGTQTDIKDSVLPIGGSTASSLSKDENSTVWGVAVGYDFTRHWALEGGYADNGSFSATRTSTAGTLGQLSARTEGTGWYLAGLGKLPVHQQFYLFGKLGIAYTTTKTDVEAGGGLVLPAGTATHRKKSETNLLWGAGAGWDFHPAVGLRLDFTRIEDVGDSSTGEGSVNTLTLGVKFRF